MSGIRAARVCLGLLLLSTLTGCGSSSSPPFTVSCTLRKLPPRFCGVARACVRANVTVKNTTGKFGRAIVYGPPFTLVHHVYPPPPALRATNVVLQLPHGQQTYIGFVVPHIDPNRPAHLILRFEPLLRPQSILVARKTFVRASSGSVLRNPDCVIRRLP